MDRVGSLGSAIQPLTSMPASKTPRALSKLPNGEVFGTVTTRQPRDLWFPAKTLVAVTQTVCWPAGAGTVPRNPWFGPAAPPGSPAGAGYAAATSGRLPLAYTCRPTPSTVTHA